MPRQYLEAEYSVLYGIATLKKKLTIDVKVSRLNKQGTSGQAREEVDAKNVYVNIDTL